FLLMDSRVFEGEEVVRVCVRVRRLLPRELKSGKSIHWNVESNRIWSPEDPRQKVYAFDSVLDSSARNGDVFESLCQHIVSSTFLGFNGTIFAYGQTSSGKTHTMMGDEDEPGIIPAAVDAIFDLIEATPSREFLLRVSYFEIYNENVVDLISESMEGRKRSLQLKEDTMGNIIVDGATELTVTEPNEIMHWLCYGEQHRHVGATNMNERSSRSHTIFRLIIESTAKQDPKAEDEELSDGAITVSHLNLVDLAGSERVSQAGTGGKSLREGGNINKSLLVLSQVISKLSEGSREFVPFRDSKLTRILKSSLGGNARTAIICTVTPAEREQTKSTLEFAFRAKNIVQHAQVNEVLDDKTYMRRLKKEMATLRQELEAERNGDRAVQEERWKSALSEKDREMQEMERERENLQTAIEVKEKQLQGLTERLLSGEAGPSHIKQNRRETWAPAPSKKANRRMSFFPRLLSNNNQEVSLEGNDTSTSVEEESPVFE
ncbi:Centromere protein E_ 312kDa, partial [Caligus rogercresseyi]